ncbi:hypothetical protein C1752_10580 [Acaryochloris thomasi RCC1774]|uniref:Uncharacterized protein n=1 Tax=Acaryochloris thomasi RCC1774 TaxID=1764569 RepID=A0A2W1J825_9CYAN|nr:hypothetical protein [Acaryochloris thomasi]PZD70573.1 hypothetical protein C1752_10580 [Acaryochloris thomasi RCC1774]
MLGPLYLPHVIFSAVVVLLWAYPRIARRFSKYIARLTAAIFGFVGFTALTTAPVRAQFLNGGREFFTTSFPDTTELTNLLFNVLLGVYVIYIAVSAFRVFGAMRSEEGGEWLEIAKTPLKIILSITVIDSMIALVVSGGGGGGGEFAALFLGLG